MPLSTMHGTIQYIKYLQIIVGEIERKDEIFCIREKIGAYIYRIYSYISQIHENPRTIILKSTK